MSTDRPSDAAILRAVAESLRDVVVPAIEAGGAPRTYERTVAVQLAGLADHARTRPPDRSDERRGDVRTALDRLRDNPIVAALQDVEREPYALASAVLVACVGRDDGDAAGARDVLRAVLVRHLDEELAVTSPLIDAFRGRLRRG